MTTPAPIGVFDSGIGGLSVLRALRAELPHEHFVYLADSAHAPYGERGDAPVVARSQAVAGHLRSTRGIKALVVACNTATAAAIHALRREHPDLPVVGVEPALKPAASATRTGHVGVIATRGTLASSKFAQLLASLQGQARFVVQACDGLASAIERAAAGGPAGQQGAQEAAALVEKYLQALGPLGQQAGAIDTLVLGCTHYVFAEDALRRVAGSGVQLVETGLPVARRAHQLLDESGLLCHGAAAAPALELLATGDAQQLQTAAARWLGGPLLPAQRVEIASGKPQP